MNKPSRKILVTGVAGFLGSHLAEKLSELNHEVIGIDNMSGGYEDNVSKKIKFFNFDCCNFQKMNEVMKSVEVVYHCAATAHEGLSVFSPVEITKNNYMASVSVFTAAIANKVKRIIFCSSMARYGDQKIPFTEDMSPKPIDPYAISKVAAENVLINLCELNKIEWVIAVPHNIIGPRQKYDDPYRNVASIMINLMLDGRQPIIYGNGEQKRCFSFYSDDIDILKILASDNNVNGEVINIGPDNEFITINELAETLAKLLNFKLDPIYMPGRPKEVLLANCSAEKVKKMLGYHPKVSLKDGLSEMIEYIQDRGIKKFKYHLDLEIISELTPDTWKNKIF